MAKNTSQSNKIRVLQLTSTSDLGGAERMALWLAESLDRERFLPFVGSLIGGGELIRRAEAAGIGTADFKFGGAFDAGGIRRLIGFIRREKIDLVQTHGLRADSVARWAARLGGARAVISTIHSLDPWRRWRHSALDRVTSPFVTRYVAVCEAARHAALRREKMRPELVDVVYIGLPERYIPRERRDEIRRKLDLKPQAYPVVGVLANLRDMKGHRHIVDALPALLKSLPDIQFLFAGRDDSRGEVAAYAEQKSVSKGIRFLGFVDDTTELLAAMDLFLLASDWEGLPVSILEAMHAGVPVIATAVGGIPEILRHEQEGLLIGPGNSGQITEAIKRLSSDWALKANLAKAADSRAQTMFSLATMTSRMEEIYLKALKIG